MSAPSHPSLYALDRAAASGRTAELADHLAGCAECTRHLGAVQERRALPDRLASLGSGATPRAPWARWVWLGGGAALVAALVLLAVWARTPPPGPEGVYVAAKGGPGALLYVKRGDRVFPWAPRERVRPGDLLRLAVVPGGFSHLTVATPGPGPGSWTVLFQGEIPPEREFDLPASWRVDAAGEVEELLVVLSRQSLRPEALSDLAVRRPRTQAVWTSMLEIEKIGGR